MYYRRKPQEIFVYVEDGRIEAMAFDKGEMLVVRGNPPPIETEEEVEEVEED